MQKERDMVKPMDIAQITLAMRDLPPDKFVQVRDFDHALRRDCGMEPIDSSDEWTREDELDMSRACLMRFEEEHPDEDWGIDYSALGGVK
jgi:hypothetical protein